MGFLDFIIDTYNFMSQEPTDEDLKWLTDDECACVVGVITFLLTTISGIVLMVINW